VFVSIIVPNLNSLLVDSTLSAIREQAFDLSQVEVVVVGKDDPGLVREDELVRFVPTAEAVSPAVARNIGMRLASGRLICFTDADCMPRVDWLAQLTHLLEQPDHYVAGGGVTFEATSYWSLCDNLSWFHEYLATSRAGERNLLPSLNLCIRREVLDDVGYFNETYPTAAGEDAEWTTRMRQAGYRLHFVPTAVVHHRPHRSTFGSFWRHSYTYGRYSVKIQAAFADFLRTPFILRHWWALLLAAPLLACVVTAKIFGQNPHLWSQLHTIPGVAISKLAWCIGAVATLYAPEKPLLDVTGPVDRQSCD
jgi:GT2 family glycosyltransferase